MKKQRSTTFPKTKGEYDDVKITDTTMIKKKKMKKKKTEVAAVVTVAVEEAEISEEMGTTCRSDDEAGPPNNFSTWWDGAADEQMSWGTYWLPSWDVEFVGECCNNVFYGDVVWDDDIWGLRAITQVPNS